jgi:hypothetical protein
VGTFWGARQSFPLTAREIAMRGSKAGERLERSFFKDRLRRFGARHPQAKSAYYLFRFLLFEGLNYARSWRKYRTKAPNKHNQHTKEFWGFEYLNYRNIFFRQYLRHLVGIQPIRKVTCFNESSWEGAGTQAVTMMRAITFARACGLTYVHTPFTAIGHADRPMPLWVAAWEAQFNFGMGEESATESDNREIVNFAYAKRNLLPLFGFFNGRDLDRKLEETIPEFRRKYYWNKSPIQNEILTICVHMRRGDATADRHYFASTSFFKKVVSEVTAVLDLRGVRYKVQIFTQGNLCDFDVPGVEIFSDVDAIWSMQQMIEADIFIMSLSGFSYVAAMISDGIKIGEKFLDGRQLSDQVIIDPNGEFDRIAFEAQLAQHIEAKTSKQKSSDVMIGC